MFWSELQPGDVVVEPDGSRAVFLIVKPGSIQTCLHWDILVLSADYLNLNSGAYRPNWIRAGKRGSIPSNHQVIRDGVVLFST